ncbi:MAG: hypothetical protein LBL59_05235 [Xanthomonadaceae bacterium]|nr:hypothetical protein [Xanthomonadaceae bacterium]
MSIPRLSTASIRPARSRTRAHSLLEPGVAGMAALGMLLVLLVPSARGHSLWFGWLPLWLVGMPLAAWWALRGFSLAWSRRLGLPGHRSHRQALRKH